MRKILFPAVAVLLSSACVLSPQADSFDAAPAGTVPAEAEPQVAPSIKWNNTGRELWFYHHVGGDCSELVHGHGRNNVWGLARLPLGEVQHHGVEAAGNGGFQVRYSCTDGSDCIQTGSLDETPNRAGSHMIPFQTTERAEGWLADVAALETACAARR
ncbi:hypothetical protein [Hyphomonas sp.]|uniref:hypothetical protein n=1 Tax=Hyphomonas sp. TaxID=87 RepID=UPI00391AE9EA